MTRHSERAGRALAHLAELDPALGALALWCDHRDGEGDTRTEGETVFYGPAFPLLPLPQQVGLAGHHVLHVALRHPNRMAAMAARLGRGFDPDLYNRAADALVNGALLAAEHALPHPAVRLADLLPAAEAELANWDVDRLYVRLSRRNGAGQGGTTPSPQRDLFVGDASADGDAQAADWRGQLARALDTGRRAGRGIGRHARQLFDLPPPSVPWEVRLRGLVTRAVSDLPRRSHRRPARRWIAMEAEARREDGPTPTFEPGLARDRRRPRIVVGLDTSSSIDDATLARFAAEVLGIARRTGAETHLLAFDEAVHAVRRLEPGQGAAPFFGLEVRRGGGTSFTGVLDHAAGLDASVAVILTDLDGEAGRAPIFPVVWAVPDAAGACAPFGTLLSLDA